jgi:Family of unknown function (DUF6152)
MTPRTAAAVVLSVASFPVPVVLAHHTVALTHDVSHTVALTGTITSILWQNPHVIYHLAVPAAPDSATGRPRTRGLERIFVVDWEIESRHLQGMRRDGVDRDTITVGDVVTMNVFLALDGSPHAATASVVLPDGRTVRLCTVTDNRCP